MKKAISSIFYIIFTLSNLLSQSDSTIQELTDKKINEFISEIRERYKEVKNIETDAADDLEEMDYLVTVINWNNSKEGWPGVGHKHSFFEFYWINHKLIKLIHSNRIADHGIYKEYIYDENENLIFYFEKNFAGAEKYEERIYLYKSQLIHYQIKSFINEDDLTLDYRLKDLNKFHFARAENVITESNWRIKWFDSSQPGLDLLHNDTTYQKKISE